MTNPIIHESTLSDRVANTEEERLAAYKVHFREVIRAGSVAVFDEGEGRVIELKVGMPTVLASDIFKWLLSCIDGSEQAGG